MNLLEKTIELERLVNLEIEKENPSNISLLFKLYKALIDFNIKSNSDQM